MAVRITICNMTEFNQMSYMSVPLWWWI